jgi:hypothetical protein
LHSKNVWGEKGGRVEMARDIFTPNKQKVREMNLRLIERYFKDRKGDLRYLGLPASTMTDVLQWQSYFQHFSAVERGRPGEECRYQHDLMLTAMQHGLADRLELLRGDMDEILLSGIDDFSNCVLYPFDVVSLDYSGGLIYKNDSGRAKRAESIESLLREQSTRNQDFLLLISCNLDNEDRGEIRRVFHDIERELEKLGVNASESIPAYLSHELEEARLKVYVSYLIGRLSARWYQCEHCKPIYYEGNRGTRMMHFSMWLKRTAEYVAGRPSRQTLVHILNLPAFHCAGGELQETDFGIPRVMIGVASQPEEQ